MFLAQDLVLSMVGVFSFRLNGVKQASQMENIVKRHKKLLEISWSIHSIICTVTQSILSQFVLGMVLGEVFLLVTTHNSLLCQVKLKGESKVVIRDVVTPGNRFD